MNSSRVFWASLLTIAGCALITATIVLLRDAQLDSGSFSFASKIKQGALSDRPLTLGELEKVSDLKEENSVILNDPGIQQAWGLKKASALKAWTITTGSRNRVVAVIDTGCDINHKDLKKNLWVNPAAKANPASFRPSPEVGGLHGWNFVSNNDDLTDNHGHGTHVAGIIGAEPGNDKGIAGVAPNVSIMCLKYFDPKVAGTDNLKNTIAAIRFAVKMKVDVINYSGGGTEYSEAEKQAIQEAERAGILFVAAAGNERTNSDHNKYYPADYGLSNIISVTAIDDQTHILPSSNYGKETVDVAAPGHDIVSTLPGNSYGRLTGTSQATAFVSGAAVLLMSNKPSFGVEDVKKHILATGDFVETMYGKTRTARQLNLYKALTVVDGNVTAAGTVASRGPSAHFTTEAYRPQSSVSQLNLLSEDLLKKLKQPERLAVDGQQ